MCPSQSESIQYALCPDGIVIIRVVGKGTHVESVALRHVFEQTRDLGDSVRYLMDLEQCTTMDSTFMGTLASIALHQRKSLGSSMIALNVKDHVRRLLDMLGLKYIVDIRKAHPDLACECIDQKRFTPANAPEIGKLDRIVMMIEAHERLVDIDSNNEIKFEGVLKGLRASLGREKKV